MGWASHYIPNEKIYHFVFPLHVLAEYNGISNLDVTLDDNLTLFIIEPLESHQIEYKFEFICNDENDDPLADELDICIKVNGDKFEPTFVIDSLIKADMIKGLELYTEEHGKWVRVYKSTNVKKG